MTKKLVGSNCKGCARNNGLGVSVLGRPERGTPPNSFPLLVSSLFAGFVNLSLLELIIVWSICINWSTNRPGGEEGVKAKWQLFLLL